MRTMIFAPFSGYIFRAFTTRIVNGSCEEWPPTDILEQLVEDASQSSLFAATLVEFIDDGSDTPQRKLKEVLKAPIASLDDIYKQVLFKAQKDDRFMMVVGTIMILAEFLSATAL